MGIVYSVKQQNVVVIEKWGKFHSLAQPGRHFKNPFTTDIAGKVSLRVRQLDVTCETKTSDNVFVEVKVSIQYNIIPDKIYDAFYKLSSPHKQIESYIFDVVRSSVPKMELDEVFLNKEMIAGDVKSELQGHMTDYGYNIITTLITDIDPDKKVKNAMNEINAAKRERIAATEKAEAYKILEIKKAEADAESKHLSGIGVANQRRAIIDGLKESVSDFSESIGVTPREVMDLITLTQYYDTLRDMTDNSKTNTIFMPHSNDPASQMRNSVIQGNIANNLPKKDLLTMPN